MTNRISEAVEALKNNLIEYRFGLGHVSGGLRNNLGGKDYPIEASEYIDVVLRGLADCISILEGNFFTRSNKECQDEFESWASKHFGGLLDLSKHEDGQYRNDKALCVWDAWGYLWNPVASGTVSIRQFNLALEIVKRGSHSSAEAVEAFRNDPVVNAMVTSIEALQLPQAKQMPSVDLMAIRQVANEMAYATAVDMMMVAQWAGRLSALLTARQEPKP